MAKLCHSPPPPPPTTTAAAAAAAALTTTTSLSCDLYYCKKSDSSSLRSSIRRPYPPPPSFQLFHCSGNRLIRKWGLVASAEVGERGISKRIVTPLKLRTRAGRCIRRLLENNPDSLLAGAAEKLAEMAAGKEGARMMRKKQSSIATTAAQSLLQQRVAILKEQECQLSVEEVMYMLVVHKFQEINVPLVPKLVYCNNNGVIDLWPSSLEKLENLFGFNLLGMIKEHLSRMLGQGHTAGNSECQGIVNFTRVRLSQIYAASVMYGYFLKTAFQRHRLERNLIPMQHDLPITCIVRLPPPDFWPCSDDKLLAMISSGSLVPRSTCIPPSTHRNTGNLDPTDLKEYITAFDPEDFKRCANIKSREALSLVEKHSLAVVENCDQKDDVLSPTAHELIAITVPSFKRILMEAVAFGSFLRDVESYVDSLYRLEDT